MTKRFISLPIFAAAGWLSAPVLSAPVAAQTVFAPPNPSGTEALQKQIEAALQPYAKEKVPPLSQATKVVIDGDHYDVSVLLAPFFAGLKPADAAAAATLHPLKDGGWTVEDAQLPPEFEFTTHERAASADAAPTPQPATPLTATYQVKLGAQDEQETLDTNGLVTSGSASITSVDVVKTGGLGASLIHLGRISNQSNLHVSTPGHYDGLTDMAVDGYAGQFADRNGVRSEVTATRLHVSGTLTGVSADALHRISAKMSTGPRLSVPPPGTPPSAAETARLRDLLLASEGLLTSADFTEEADGVKFDVSGHAGGFGKVALTFGGQAPQDVLTARVGLTLEGLRLDDLPPELAAYVPSRISFRPMASNLSVTDLTKLALDALSPTAPIDPATGKPAPPIGDYQALFSHGGIQVGFDQLAIAMAGAQFAGNGSFIFAGPQSVSGAAEITGQGLDDLITRLQSDPVAARAAPYIILLKGIAKTTPDGAIWQVTIQDNKVLVNGLDLAALAATMH